MTGFSIFSIPFIGKACRVPRNERTKFQRALVGTIDAWLHFNGRMPWNAMKYDVTIFRGQPYYESLCGLRTWVLYDCGGYLYGWHEQNREGYAFFETWEQVHGDKPRPRMRWMSRIRSPKLPSGALADIIDVDGIVVGQTMYKHS